MVELFGRTVLAGVGLMVGGMLGLLVIAMILLLMDGLQMLWLRQALWLRWKWNQLNDKAKGQDDG